MRLEKQLSGCKESLPGRTAGRREASRSPDPQPFCPGPERSRTRSAAAPMLFSVVTPTHNRADFLPEALASVQVSVLAGVDAAWEHLIYDGGSTDATADV